jgi:hypothetical protein
MPYACGTGNAIVAGGVAASAQVSRYPSAQVEGRRRPTDASRHRAARTATGRAVSTARPIATATTSIQFVLVTVNACATWVAERAPANVMLVEPTFATPGTLTFRLVMTPSAFA